MARTPGDLALRLFGPDKFSLLGRTHSSIIRTGTLKEDCAMPPLAWRVFVFTV